MQSLKKLFILVLPFLVLVYGQETSGSSRGSINKQDKEELNLVTVHAEDAHLPSILAILAKESGYNIVTDPNVNRQEKISIHLDDVPIEQAINLVVRAVGLSYEVVGNCFLIADIGAEMSEHSEVSRGRALYSHKRSTPYCPAVKKRNTETSNNS